MKRDCVVSICVVFVCILLSQAGCKLERQSSAVPGAVLAQAPAQPALPPAPPTTADANQGNPLIEFDKVVYDFGEIGPETRNVCEFNFKNAGTGILKITNVTKTCGCTTSTLEKTEYAAGESGTLTVKYYSSTRPGPVSKELTVFSNDKDNPSVVLTVKSNIVLKVSVKPEKINLLLNAENAGCPDIVLTSLDGQPFSISSFKSTSKYITADVNSSIKATSLVIKPKVDMSKLSDELNGSIDIGLTHPGCRIVVVPFSVTPRFNTKPASIIILKAEPGKPVSPNKELWLMNNYGEDFEVESASSANGSIKVVKQEKIDNRYRFELQITPPAAGKGGPKLFRDTFIIKLKNGEKVKVLCSLFYASAKK